MTVPDRKIYGATGEIGRDGLLSAEQINLLDHIQERAADGVHDYLNSMQRGDPFPLVAMATGFGKGKIIHRVIEKQLRDNPGSQVLVVAGTKHVLVRQTHTSLNGYQQTQPQNYDYRIAEDIDLLSEETTTFDEPEFSEQRSYLFKTGRYDDTDPTVNVQIATIQKIQSEYKRGVLRSGQFDLVIVDEVHNVGTL